MDTPISTLVSGNVTIFVLVHPLCSMVPFVSSSGSGQPKEREGFLYH